MDRKIIGIKMTNRGHQKKRKIKTDKVTDCQNNFSYFSPKAINFSIIAFLLLLAFIFSLL